METFYILTRTEFYEYDGESEIDKMNLIITQKERKKKEGTQDKKLPTFDSYQNLSYCSSPTQTKNIPKVKKTKTKRHSQRDFDHVFCHQDTVENRDKDSFTS